jgi:hypothetical protein
VFCCCLSETQLGRLELFMWILAKSSGFFRNLYPIKGK